MHSGCQAPLFRDVGWTAWPEGQDNIRVAGEMEKGRLLPRVSASPNHYNK